MQVLSVFLRISPAQSNWKFMQIMPRFWIWKHKQAWLFVSFRKKVRSELIHKYFCLRIPQYFGMFITATNWAISIRFFFCLSFTILLAVDYYFGLSTKELMFAVWWSDWQFVFVLKPIFALMRYINSCNQKPIMNFPS